MPSNLVRSLFGLLLPTGLLAQEIPPAEYAARRDSLTARMDSGVVVAFGAPDPVSIGRWTQLPAFRYLTGFLEPNAVLVLVKRDGTASGTLSPPREIPAGRSTTGSRPTPPPSPDRAGSPCARFPLSLRWWIRWPASVCRSTIFGTTPPGMRRARTRSPGAPVSSLAWWRGSRVAAPGSRRASTARQPSGHKEPGRAGAAAPRDRHHGRLSQTGHATGQAGDVGV